MDEKTLGLYLSRILSGLLIFLYNNKKYKLIYPDMILKYDAEVYAQEQYENIKYNDWIQDEHIVDALISMGLWNSQGDSNLKNIEKQIEDLKVDLYKNFLNPSKLKSLRKQLKISKAVYNKYYEIRHSLDSCTANGYSQILKNQYILIHSLYDQNNIRIFNTLEDTDYNILNQLSSTINNYHIDMPTYRAIARSEIWKNYWSANNDNLFGKPTINWTDEQKTLVVMTKMYESAFSHSESPPESVVEDDDLFDGWMIYQKREFEKARNKNRTEKLLVGKNLDKANEIFVMAHSQGEAQNIYDLNDDTSRNIIKERGTTIDRTGSVDDQNLPDVQRKIITESNEIYKSNIRK